MKESIKKFIQEFLEKLKIEINSITVLNKEDNIIFIKIETPDSGLLIGNHGNNFLALQSILRSILSNKYDKKIRIHLEINDYIHNKDARLFDLVKKDIIKAKQTGRNMKLPKLNAYERRKIHSYVAELGDDEIKTESIGEGENRRLYILLIKNIKKIKPNSKVKLEIDLDSADI